MGVSADTARVVSARRRCSDQSSSSRMRNSPTAATCAGRLPRRGSPGAPDGFGRTDAGEHEFPSPPRRMRLLAVWAAVGVLGFAASAPRCTSAASGVRGSPLHDPATGDGRSPRPSQVAAPFVAPATRYSAGHRGIDLAAASGTPVLAPTDGVVSFAGTVVGSPARDDRPRRRRAGEPRAGAGVGRRGRARGTRGSRSASVAAGGHCGDGCLHLGVRVHGEYVSPLAFLTGLPRAVLLPLGR